MERGGDGGPLQHQRLRLSPLCSRLRGAFGFFALRESCGLLMLSFLAVCGVGRA